MPRVLHVITSLDPDGAQTMLLKLVSRSHGDRFRHAVVALRGGSLARRFADLGVDVSIAGVSRPTSLPAAFFRLRRAVRAARPDVIHGWLAHGNVAAEAARALGAPRATVLWNVRDTNPDLHAKGFGPRAVPRLAGLLSRRPARVVNNSVESARVHTETLGYDPERWEIVPNGFDTSEFRPSPAARRAVREEIGVADGAPLVGLVKRYHADKGHGVFFDAAREIAATRPDARFLLAGRGTGRDNAAVLDELSARGLSDRFVLLGHRDDARRVHCALDVAVSSSETEGFPNTIGEAMACGVPCVVTDVGDSARLVGDTGSVVAPRDPSALAAAVGALLDLDASAREALGDRARERVEREYSLDAVVGLYERLYASAARTGSEGTVLSPCAE